MNISGYMNKLNSIGKYVLIAVFALNILSLSYASSAQLSSALMVLCSDAKLFLGVTAMVLVVLAGAVYAIGQILGAETRARAAVWATAMLTGAVIGIVIYVVLPPILTALMGGTNYGGNGC